MNFLLGNAFSPRTSLLVPRSSPRRGILLLVVLSMLTLFLLIGTAFIVSANQYRKASKVRAKATEASNSSVDQGNMLDEVINQIVRDTNNQNSTLRFHSLLRDMYGNDGLMAEIVVSDWAGGNASLTGRQMIQFQLDLTTLTDQFGIRYNSMNRQLSPFSNAYNGLVLTFLDGPVRGQSVRITSYEPQVVGGQPARFRVMAPRKANGTNLVPADFAKLNNSRILINGRPFNGTGVGYSTPIRRTITNVRLGFEETVPTTSSSRRLPIALMPNPVFTNANQISNIYFLTNLQQAASPAERERIIRLTGLTGIGGSDESYDAVDYQNMMLAMLPTNPVESVATNNPDLGNMILPSLHRPALLSYWRAQLRSTPPELQEDPNLLRKVLLRPNWLDHPNFTGSNPEFANIAAADRLPKLNQMIFGPWDVDNDKDGIRDSIWVDVGLPVRENADGRLVKPLAAILVLDMDGRLNLNAHGSEDIANANPNPTFSLPIAGTGNTTNLLPQGQGYGPAEISLGPVMPGLDRLARWKWYKRIFHGLATSDRLVPSDIASKLILRRRVGKLGGKDNVPGRGGARNFDTAAQMKMQGVPSWAAGDVTRAMIQGGYVTPPDYRGRYAVGLNDFGQPVFEAMRDNSVPLNVDTPYETDLSIGAARGESADADDSPYSMAEMERVLRAYDPDAGALPSRLWELAGEFKPNAAATTPDLERLNLWRTTLTADSYDLPVPSVVLPDWMHKGPNGIVDNGANSDDFEDVMGRPPVNLTFADLLEYRIRVAQSPLWQASADAANPTRLPLIRRALRKLLPPDLADGLRLDINRPLGNGRDDNNNGVVDEPGEVGTGGNEAPYWASNDPQIRAAGFTDNHGTFRDERILLEDRNNDNIFGDTADLNLIGVSGAVDSPSEFVTVHNLRRQTLARDLYIVAMTLADPFDLTTKKGKAKARQLAQWAINVVDFRDPDNIMTAFEYDVNPFDGWAVDGNTNDVTEWVGADTKANTNDDVGGLVWGAESPEMLISETLAWHDRRTENHGDEAPANGGSRGTVPFPANDPKVKIPDTDYDQRFVPQGAGFVELLCTVPENPAVNADTHAVNNSGNDIGIDMAAVDEVTGNSPCWRLMIYKTNAKSNGGPGKDPDSRVFVDRPKLADRCVYFTDFDPETVNAGRWDKDGVAFFADTTNRVPTVRPGRYMVVGAGKSLGGGKYLASFGNMPGQTKDSNRGISLNTSPTTNSAVSIQDMSGNTISDMDGFGMEAPARISSVAIINQVDKGGVSEERRFTFSEPATGYPQIHKSSRRKVDPVNNNPYYDPPIDIPLDDQRFLGGGGGGLAQGGGGGGGGGLGQRNKQQDQGGRNAFRDGESRLMLPVRGAGGGIGKGAAAGGGMGSNVGQNGRTVPGFSWVYLQRLANPLLPWNPEPFLDNGTTSNTKHDPTLAVNPYMTIDTSGVNVTVFNGLSRFELRAKTGVVKKGENRIAKYPNTTAGRSFSSLQRGRLNNPLDPIGDLTGFQNEVTGKTDARVLGHLNPDIKPANDYRANLWNPESVGRTAKGAVAGLWRNKTTPDITHNLTSVPDCTLGFLNEPFRRKGATGRNETKVEPEKPFPWYTWNNRPYANANELMLVPAFRSSQLLQAFSYRTSTNNKINYDGKVNEIPLTTSGENLVLDGPFGHLLNFYRTDSKGTDGVLLTADDQGIAGLHRLLDYVHVPSPYVGSETWLSPLSFGSAMVTSVDDPRYLRQPPFNQISEYREPGRVNLNTIVSPHVWDGGVLHRELEKPALPWNPLTNNYQMPNSAAGYPGHAGPLFVNVPGTAASNNNGMVETRRGYPGRTVSASGLANDDQMLLLDDRVPTFFANPFRAASAANFVPLNNLQRPEVESTLLRRQAFNPGIDGEWGRPGEDGGDPRIPDDLGEFNPQTPRPADLEDKDLSFGGVTSFDSVSSTPFEYNNSERNAYFAYQPMARLSSMTTNRSNVYAVWVTIGFFEVEKAPDWASNEPYPDLAGTRVRDRFNGNKDLYDKVYPEGYMFGQEAGSDTGDIRRVREFAMIDRTVPVAFEPGQNHNVDKAIRLRRRIE